MLGVATPNVCGRRSGTYARQQHSVHTGRGGGTPGQKKGGIMAGRRTSSSGGIGRSRRTRVGRLVAAMCATFVATMSLSPFVSAARPITSLTWSPTDLSFGSLAVGGLDQKSIVLANTGTKTIRRPSIAVTGIDYFIGSENCSLSVLRSGDYCTVTIVFAPSATGPSTGTVSTTASKTLFAANLAGTGTAVAVPTPADTNAAEPLHSCAVNGVAGVTCWGHNEYGQLGVGDLRARTSPVPVAGLTAPIAAVATGDFHSCALTVVGAVQCWGRNDLGQLGTGTGPDSATPLDVIGLSSDVIAISSAGSLTCALHSDRTVACWGTHDVALLPSGLRHARNPRPAGDSLSP